MGVGFISKKTLNFMTQPAFPTVKSRLSGWGRYPVLDSQLQRPEKLSTVSQIVSQNLPLLARGAGRSYGDAALNSQGNLLLTERLNRLLAFDAKTGILRCEAGVTIQEILEVFVPQGWFPKITPGTKFVTLGGAIAADVHGKNHHRDGGFSSCVRNFQLILANGETVTCSREQNSDLFWATMGGMGLTGIVTEVELELNPIETAYINCHTLKAKNLDEAMQQFDEYEPHYRYSVAWIDCLARGKSLGRSILMLGNFATLDEFNAQQQVHPLLLPPKRRFKVPLTPPAGLLNPYTMKAFNNLYYTTKTATPTQTLVDYDSFFYPLDFVEDWNRLYGQPGFIQYQCVFPTEVSREALTKILERCSRQGWGSFLAVLKRLGTQPGWLSFPIAGYTLALDIAVRPGLGEFIAELDQMVIRYGGRVYLAKDALLSAESFRAMYSAFPQWLEVKSQVDPENKFTSALGLRLQMGAK